MSDARRIIHSGWVGAADPKDWFTFTLAQTTLVNIGLESFGRGVEITLRNSNQAFLAQDTALAGVTSFSDASLVRVLAAGTYLVEVNEQTSGRNAGSNYALTLSYGALPAGGRDVDNAGNTLLTARQLGALTQDKLVFSDFVGTVDTTDLYAFTLNTAMYVEATLGSIGISQSVGLALLNLSGNEIGSNIANDRGDGSVARFLEAGSYFVRVSSTNFNSGYSLVLEGTEVPDFAGNTTPTARPLFPFTATPQVFRDTVGDTIDPRDYYSFTLTEATRIEAWVSDVDGRGDRVSFSIRNSADGAIAFSAGSPSSTFPQGIIAQLGAGSYFVLVGNSNLSPADYQLEIRGAAIPDSAGATIATARALGAIPAAGLNVSDMIGAVDPTDIFSFTLTASQTVNLTAFSQGRDTLNLALLDSAGSRIAEDGASSFAEASLIRLLGPGTYHARITGTDFATPYTLSITTGLPVTGGPASDGAGNTIGTARSIGALSGTQTFADWVGTGDAADWYTFTLAAPSDIRISLDGLTALSTLALTNSVGSTINSIAGDGTSAGWIVRPLAAGTYGLSVTSNGNTGYRLAAAATPIADGAGNTLPTARALGVLTTTELSFTDFVGGVDQVDNYAFNVAGVTTVTARLSGIENSTNTTLSLHDAVGNTLFTITGDEARPVGIAVNLPTIVGSYYWRVTSPDFNQGTGYTLAINASPFPDTAGDSAATPLLLSPGSYIVGSGIDETLSGAATADVIEGRGGNDLLDGGPGADAMFGDSGNDHYIVDHLGDAVTEKPGNGQDTVSVGVSEWIVPLNVETARLSGNATTLSGNRDADILIANGALSSSLSGDAGDDLLLGGAGDDTLIGGAGNDTYRVNGLGDRVFETRTIASLIDAGGVDTVQSAVSFNLSASPGVWFVEHLVLTGTGNINGIGNGLANILTGNVGNNLLNGGLGNDTLIGGAGNDTYIVNAAGDRVFETTTTASLIDAGGIDTVQSAVSFNLNASVGVRFVENLVLTGTANFNGTGNGLANSLTGNAGNNVLNGGLGNDTLIGGAGNDRLDGSVGIDILIGGIGQDTLVGGAGNDLFRVNSIAESSLAAPDRILDFSFSAINGFDRVDLRSIDANIGAAGDQAFTYRGANFTGAAGDLRVQAQGGGVFVAAGDVNGDGLADFAIAVQSGTAPVAGWFLL